MKKIVLNREEIPVNDEWTLAALLEEKKMNGSGVAAAVNNRVVPRDKWGETLLEENAKVTVIRATCGG